MDTAQAIVALATIGILTAFSMWQSSQMDNLLADYRSLLGETIELNETIESQQVTIKNMETSIITLVQVQADEPKEHPLHSKPFQYDFPLSS